MPVKSSSEDRDNKPWSVKPQESRTDSEGHFTIVFSLLKTSQLLKYLLRGYKCLVRLVMAVCITGLPSFPEVT